MPRSMWSGTVSFGLVAIPVGIVPAVRPQRVSFNMLHDKDHARLQRRMFCPADRIFVDREHIVRGFEVEPGRYVVVTDDELNGLEPERAQTIEINDFVDLASIDPLYYDRPYYLFPEKGGDKPYRLLAETLAQTRKAGIAEFVMHEREHLVALRGIEGALCLLTLHYEQERIQPAGLAPGGAPEEALVERLGHVVDRMTASFDIGKHRDDDRERMLELIRKKREEEGVVEAPEVGEEEEGEEPIDLIAALEESLERARQKKAG